MKNVLSAELYKLGRNRLLLPCVALVYIWAGVLYGLEGAEIYHTYKGLELFGLPALAWIPYCFTTVLVTGLLIGGDFSRGTIKNALAAGVARKDYYFARMMILMLMTAAAFVSGQLAYIICHLVHPQGNSGREIELLGAKAAVYTMVALLQLLAYAALVNAICYFVKKQVAAMVTGMVLVYMEAIIRQLVEAGNMPFLRQAVQYLPARVLYRMFSLAVYDQILTMDFLKYGISALVIIVGCSIAGYVKFEYYLGEY